MDKKLVLTVIGIVVAVCLIGGVGYAIYNRSHSTTNFNEQSIEKDFSNTESAGDITLADRLEALQQAKITPTSQVSANEKVANIASESTRILVENTIIDIYIFDSIGAQQKASLYTSSPDYKENKTDNETAFIFEYKNSTIVIYTDNPTLAEKAQTALTK